MQFEIYAASMIALFESDLCAKGEKFIQLQIDACRLAHTHPKIIKPNITDKRTVPSPGKAAKVQ